MPMLYPYRLFISHAWRYDDDYNRLVNLPDEAPHFSYRNYSVPRDKPVVDPNTEVGYRTLRKALDEQIRPAQCVLIASGMYAAYLQWIQVEVDIARNYGKPIIGVIPWGQMRTPEAVRAVATEMVAWSTISIVAAIRRQVP